MPLESIFQWINDELGWGEYNPPFTKSEPGIQVKREPGNDHTIGYSTDIFTTLLVALVLYISNFHHFSLLALLVAQVLH